MKPDKRTPTEIAQDLDRQADEVIRASEGPNGLTDAISKQNPFKSVEQAISSAPPARDARDSEINPYEDGVMLED